MIREFQIENFKSIKKMKLDLGRVNVFIGENGSGKSNILEAIALAGAAAADKLDNEFLASRGIRAAEPRHMRCALNAESAQGDITLSIEASSRTKLKFNLSHDGRPYSSWKCESEGETSFEVRPDRLLSVFEKMLADREADDGIDKEKSTLLKMLDPASLSSTIDALRELKSKVDADETATLVFKAPSLDGLHGGKSQDAESIKDFVIYSPENYSLRMFQKEGQIEPLGIQGEGLLKFLQVLSNAPEYAEATKSIKDRLRVLAWFKDLNVPHTPTSLASKIEIKDRYLGDEAGHLDQISANEGFLFLLFYFSLFSTKLTPRFFAVDNVDASLNPKLCRHLIAELAQLAEQNDKQVILTTHNPATLDGLDLTDDEQRLFVISRGEEGETKIRRIKRKEGNSRDIKLSAAFINGYLGGLPKNF